MMGPVWDDLPHLDDGTLVRWLDGECGQEEERLVAQHLERCPRCRVAAADLDRAGDRLGAVLFAFDEEVRRARSRKLLIRLVAAWRRVSRTARWSIGAAVVLAVLLTPPARAWLTAAWDLLAARAPPARVTEAPAYALSFTPSDSVFTVTFEDAQPEGVLWITADSAAAVSMRIIGALSSDEMAVEPSGVRIRNDRRSAATYELTVPLTVSVVELHVEGRLIGRYRPSAIVGRMEASLVGN